MAHALLYFDISNTVQPKLHQLEVYQANRRALRHYQRKPLRGKLRTFEIFESSHQRNFGMQRFNWETLWEGLASRHHVLGKDSGDMVSGENAQVLATLLSQRLRAAFGSEATSEDERQQ